MEGCPSGDLLSELDVRRAIPAARIRGDQRQRSQGGPSRDEWNAQVRLESELGDEAEVLLVAGGRPEELRVHLWSERRHASSDHARDGVRSARDRRILVQQAIGHRLLRLVGVDRGQAHDPPVRLRHVDQTQVCQVPNHELREPDVRPRVIERLGEQIAHSRRRGQALRGPTLGIEQAGVIDGQACPLPQLFGQADVRLLVEPAGLGRHHRQRTEGFSARGEGNGDRRAQPEVSHDPQSLRIVDGLLEELVRDLPIPLRDSGSRNLHRTGLVIWPGGKSPPKLVGELDLGRIDVCDREIRDGPLLVDEVDRVPVSQGRNHQLSELCQSRLVVEGRLEDLSAGGEVFEAPSRRPARLFALARHATLRLPCPSVFVVDGNQALTMQ